MLSALRPTLILLLLLTALTGVAYPLLITGVAQLAFHERANGSLIEHDGHPVGSRLIGQSFTDPGHFWGRPSVTGPQPYNGTASSGSNLGPLNRALLALVKGRATTLRDADPGNESPIPVELVQASASGLDPDISPGAARWQAARVARARQLDVESVLALIEQQSMPAPLGFLGEARVNVLALNLAIDERARKATQ